MSARLFALALLLTACDTAGHDAEWALRFDEPDVAARSALLEALVLDGSCAGEVIYRAEVPREGAGPMPPVLEPGRYGVAALARDDRCATIARGCVEVELPLPANARVVVPLRHSEEVPACAASRCRAGRCEGGAAPDDAGFVAADGGVELPDAGPMDASTHDAGGPDAGRPDAGRPDAGAGCDVELGSTCYWFSTATLDWYEAEDACIRWGGHLVSYADEGEETTLRMANAPAPHWTGLADGSSEGTFTWTDGTALGYSRWASGSPRSSPPWRDCVLSTVAGWQDSRCTDRHGFVCER